MKSRFLSRRAALLVVSFAFVAGIVSARLVRSRMNAATPVEITIALALPGDGVARVQSVLADYTRTHPDVVVHVEPAVAVDAEKWLRSHRAQVALGDRASLGGADRAFEPLFAGDYVILAYDRTRVPTAPKSWDEILRTSASLKTRGSSYGIGIPEDGYSVLPLLANALRPDVSPAEAERGAERVFALLDRARFGLGLTPVACSMACVADGLARGELAFGLVGEWRLPALRSALGDRLGVVAVPQIADAAPSRDPLAVVYGFALGDDLTDAQADAARALGDVLRKRDALARALGKLPIESSGDLRIGADTSHDAERARLNALEPAVQALWSDATHGRATPADAARALVALR